MSSGSFCKPKLVVSNRGKDCESCRLAMGDALPFGSNDMESESPFDPMHYDVKGKGHHILLPS